MVGYCRSLRSCVVHCRYDDRSRRGGDHGQLQNPGFEARTSPAPERTAQAAGRGGTHDQCCPIGSTGAQTPSCEAGPRPNHPPPTQKQPFVCHERAQAPIGVSLVNPDERAAAVKRLTFLVAAVLIWAAAIFCKLISMQALHHQKYLSLARKQQEHAITVQAPRGYIYDRNDRPLAISVPVDSVFVNPLRLPDVSIAAEEMAPILGLDRQKLEHDLRDAIEDHRGFLWVKRKISSEESRRLHDLKFDWIEFETESVREYPDGGIAAHLLGGVYKDEDGVAGVEKSFDALLKGKPGTEDSILDVKKRVLDAQSDKPAEPGQSLTLTIDSRIQYVAECEIKAAVHKHKCRSGSVIAMN